MDTVKKNSKKKTEKPTSTEPKRKEGNQPEWDPVLLASQLEAWFEEKRSNCNVQMVPNDSGRLFPVMTGQVPFVDDFCFETKNPITGKRLGKHIYTLAHRCPELADALSACACARAAKIDAGAMVGAIPANYATLAQKQTSAAGFVEKQEIEQSGSVEIGFKLTVVNEA